ncbi:MAG: FAD-dependent monooxygenase [Marinobacter sp.]|uniref:FAD-dependent monooxygenase n=1 Tax=Marinobacter sp. TaxID=50741 RepID=UPI00299DEA16|nr:FAD-dependent monooxygenase [Marinobacter sp.]MDX1635927.1 FAD-dependent monooxygenase [Marinobacter sp.]
MTQTLDIVVVGAGMVGAALATGLGQAGLRVALVDRAPAPEADTRREPDLRVSALSVGSEQYLRRLGAWSGIEQQRLTPYRRLSVWDQTASPLSALGRTPPRTTFSAAELGASHLGHIVENRVTQYALWQTAAGQDSVTLIPEDAIVAMTEATDQVEVILESGKRLNCQLVVGADGGNSRVRELAGIGISRDQYQQQALVASVRYTGPVQDITWQAFYPSGPRAFLPLHGDGPESWASLVWYDDPAVLAELKALPEDQFLARVQQAFPADLPPLTALAGRASFAIARQHASQYVSGRVVLVGDAAHTINPLAGQGVNLGFQDVECLQGLMREARRAGDDLAAPHRLQSYQDQRRPANRRMMLTMDAFYYLFSNRLPPLHLARNLGLGLAQRLPFARNQVARYAMGLAPETPPGLAGLLSRLPRPGFIKSQKGS